MDARSQKERKFIFVKYQKLLVYLSLMCLFIMHLIWWWLYVIWMKDEAQLWLRRRGIWPTGSDAILNMLLTFSGMSGFIPFPLLTESNSCSSKDRRTTHSEDDYSYLVNLSGPSIEKELKTLTRYTWHACATLALGGTGRWKALWSNQQRAEKQRLEKSVCNVKLQQDKYL